MQIKNNLGAAKNRFLFLQAANLTISLWLIIVITSELISYASIFVGKARVSQAFALFPAAKADLMLHYSSLGHWPNKKKLTDKTSGYSEIIDQILFDGKGAVNVYFTAKHPNLSNKVLSFIANKALNGQSNQIIWSCGYAVPLEGFKPMSVNLTNVGQKYLSNICK